MFFGAVIKLLLTGFSPVYAGYSFDESKQMQSIADESVESRRGGVGNVLDVESFFDGYDSLESNRHPRTFYPKDQPIRSSTAIDGEDWDIVVQDDYSSIQVAGNTAEENERWKIILMNKPWKKYV